MSWTKEVTIWCDGEECNEWERTGNSTVSTTRNNLSPGWTFTNGNDYCPDCSGPEGEMQLDLEGNPL